MRSLVLAICLSVVTPFAVADDWEFVLEPYMLGASIEGDSAIGQANGIEVDVDFSRILETLRMAGMVRFEAVHDSNWGVVLDYGFMDLGDDLSGPRGGIADIKLRQGILQANVLRRHELENSTLDVLFGVRWWDNDIELELDPALLPISPSLEIEEDWVDLILGMRWQTRLNDRWKFQVSGDIGGFGMEADMTSQLSLGAIYNINDRLDLDLRYQAMWVDYETGNEGERDYFAYDTVTHGPLIGLIIRF